MSQESYKELYDKIIKAGSANFSWFGGGGTHTGGYGLMQNPVEYSQYIAWWKERVPSGLENMAVLGLGTGGELRFFHENVGFKHCWAIENYVFEQETQRIAENIEKFKEKVTIFKLNSTDAETWIRISRLPELDYIFIDGGHDYKTVNNDILMCLKKTKLIGFHDRHASYKATDANPIEVGQVLDPWLRSGILNVVQEFKDTSETPFGLTICEVNL